MKVKIGLDVLIEKEFTPLRGKKIALLCNQASIDSQLQHVLEIMYPSHQNNFFQIEAVFGPQHGLWGHTQDNMIEWEGGTDRRTGLKIFSLYGKMRRPQSYQLQNIDLFVIDLQDVGARYYTFIWTMALCMEACQELKIPMLVLDRPNPIGGKHIEGTLLQPEFKSFVGLYPLTQRHGMTIGEIALYLNNEYFPKLTLQVEKVIGWRREMHFPETGLIWVMPSPNMPCYDTALVYPGMCLLEGTNLSEGRGTTRPFEIFGAPWLDGWELCSYLNRLNLPGVYIRPIQFQPTFQKYAGQICEGGFIHVTDRIAYKPVLTALAILSEVIKRYPQKFQWKKPPYEYEYDKLPFDILAGNDWLRKLLVEEKDLSEIEKWLLDDVEKFKETHEKYLLYE